MTRTPLVLLVLALVLVTASATPRCRHLRVNPQAPVQLALLVSAHASSETGHCDRTSAEGVQVYEAVRFALRRINQNRGQVDGRIVSDSFLPGVKLGVYVLDTCSIIGDPVEQLMRCVAGHTRILGVLDATGTGDGGTRSSHPDLPVLSVSEPHRLPPEQRARALAKFVLELGWREVSVAVGDEDEDMLTASLLETVLSGYSLCLRGVVPVQALPTAPLARHLVVVVGSAEVAGVVAQLQRRRMGEGLAGVLISSAPRLQDRPALVGRLPAPLYFLPDYPATLRHLEKEWEEMQSVTIPRLLSNSLFINHVMDRLGCRLFNYTAEPRTDRRPICRDFNLSEDDLDRLERSRLALPVVHAVFTFANALFSAWQAECGNRPGSCPRLDRLSPGAFQRLYLEPLVFSHAAPGTRSPPELDGLGRGDGHLSGLTVPLVGLQTAPGPTGALHLRQLSLYSGQLPPLDGNGTRLQCTRHAPPPPQLDRLVTAETAPTPVRAAPPVRITTTVPSPPPPPSPTLVSHSHVQEARRRRPPPGRGRNRLVSTRRRPESGTVSGIRTDELVAPLLTFSPSRGTSSRPAPAVGEESSNIQKLIPAPPDLQPAATAPAAFPPPPRRNSLQSLRLSNKRRRPVALTPTPAPALTSSPSPVTPRPGPWRMSPPQIPVIDLAGLAAAPGVGVPTEPHTEGPTTTETGAGGRVTGVTVPAPDQSTASNGGVVTLASNGGPAIKVVITSMPTKEDEKSEKLRTEDLNGREQSPNATTVHSEKETSSENKAERHQLTSERPVELPDSTAERPTEVSDAVAHPPDPAPQQLNRTTGPSAPQPLAASDSRPNPSSQRPDGTTNASSARPPAPLISTPSVDTRDPVSIRPVEAPDLHLRPPEVPPPTSSHPAPAPGPNPESAPPTPEAAISADQSEIARIVASLLQSTPATGVAPPKPVNGHSRPPPNSTAKEGQEPPAPPPVPQPPLPPLGKELQPPGPWPVPPPAPQGSTTEAKPDHSTERADRLETTTDAEEGQETSTEKQDGSSTVTERNGGSNDNIIKENEPVTTTESQNATNVNTKASDSTEDGKSELHHNGPITGGLTTSATSSAELDGQESIVTQISVSGGPTRQRVNSGGVGLSRRPPVRPGGEDSHDLSSTPSKRVTLTATGGRPGSRPSATNEGQDDKRRPTVARPATTTELSSPRTPETSPPEAVTAAPVNSLPPPDLVTPPPVPTPEPTTPGSMEAPARVVALLGIHGPGRRVCGGAVSADGLQRWEALRWTVTRLSRRLRLHVRLEPADHCGSAARAARLLAVGPPPLAVIHDLPGAMVGAVTGALSGRNVTVLRLAAGERTAPPLGEFSVQPPPGWQPALLAALVRALGLRRLLVLHSQPPRQRALAAAVSAQLRRDVPCLSTAALSPDLGGMTAAADSTHGRAILALLQPTDMDHLFKQLAARPGRRDPLFFVGDASWGDNIRLLRRHSLVVDNAVIVRARRLDVSEFGDQFLRTRGADERQTVSSSAAVPWTAWRAQYWRQCGARCSLETDSVEDALLAANSLMLALARLQPTGCGDRPQTDTTCQPRPGVSGGLAEALQTGPAVPGPGEPAVLHFDSERWAVRRADVLNLRDMRRIPTVREMHYVKVGEVDGVGAYLSTPVVANTAKGREVPAASWIQGCPINTTDRTEEKGAASDNRTTMNGAASENGQTTEEAASEDGSATEGADSEVAAEADGAVSEAATEVEKAASGDEPMNTTQKDATTEEAASTSETTERTVQKPVTTSKTEQTPDSTEETVQNPETTEQTEKTETTQSSTAEQTIPKHLTPPELMSHEPVKSGETVQAAITTEHTVQKPGTTESRQPLNTTNPASDVPDETSRPTNATESAGAPGATRPGEDGTKTTTTTDQSTATGSSETSPAVAVDDDATEDSKHVKHMPENATTTPGARPEVGSANVTTPQPKGSPAPASANTTSERTCNETDTDTSTTSAAGLADETADLTGVTSGLSTGSAANEANNPNNSYESIDTTHHAKPSNVSVTAIQQQPVPPKNDSSNGEAKLPDEDEANEAEAETKLNMSSDRSGTTTTSKSPNQTTPMRPVDTIRETTLQASEDEIKSIRATKANESTTVQSSVESPDTTGADRTKVIGLPDHVSNTKPLTFSKPNMNVISQTAQITGITSSSSSAASSGSRVTPATTEIIRAPVVTIPVTQTKAPPRPVEKPDLKPASISSATSLVSKILSELTSTARTTSASTTEAKEVGVEPGTTGSTLASQPAPTEAASAPKFTSTMASTSRATSTIESILRKMTKSMPTSTTAGTTEAANTSLQTAATTEAGDRRVAPGQEPVPLPPLPEPHLAAGGGSRWYLALSVDARGHGEGALDCGRPRATALAALDWAAAALRRAWRRRPHHRPGLLLLDGCQQPLRRQQQAALLLAAAGRPPRRLAGLVDLTGSEAVAAAFRRQRVPSVAAAAGSDSGRLSLSPDPQTAAAALGRLLEQQQWRLVSVAHAPDSAWHSSVLSALTSGPRSPRLASSETLSSEPGGGQLAAAAESLAAARRRGAHVLITLLPAPVTARLLDALRQHAVRLMVITVDISRSDLASYSGMAGAVRLVPPVPPPPPGRPPVTALTADLWRAAGSEQRGEGIEDESWEDAVTAVSALSAHLITLLDAICPPSESQSGAGPAAPVDCDLSTLDAFDADDLTRHVTSLTFPGANGQPTSFLDNYYLASAPLQVESFWVDPESGDAHWEPVGNCTVQLGLQLEPERLVAYREDGLPVLAAEIHSTCPSCQPPPDQPHIMEVALAGSSYQLAVLAPVHREGSDMFRCGPLADTETLVGVAAAAWTVASSRLPVGARVLDTCGRPERARDQLFALLSSAAADPRRLLGVLSLSEASGAAVAGMLRQAGVPHVWLPLSGHGGAYDRLVGPYRAVPPVELEVHAVVTLARRFDWRYLSVVHSTDAYGLWARQLLAETAPQHHICVGSVIGVGDGFGAAEAGGALAELGRDSAASTVIVLVSRPEQMRLLLAAVAAAESDLRDRLLFVIGRHGGAPEGDESLAPALRRAVFVSLPQSPPMTAVSRWMATMSVDSHAPLPDEWFAELAERRRWCEEAAAAGDGRASEPDCTALPSGQSPPPVSPYVHQVSAAVSALLQTLSDYLQRHCIPGQSCAQLVGSELQEALDARLANSSSATPQRPRLLSGELHLWAVPDGTVPRQLGSYARGLLSLADEAAEWQTTLEQHRSACTEGPCLATCAPQTDLLATRDGETPATPQEALRSVFGVVSIALSAVGVLVALGCLAYFTLSAGSRVCRSPIDAQVLIGLALICCDNVVFLLPASAAVCGARRFLTGLAYGTVYSALLVKMIQVWRVAGGRCDELSQRGALLLVSLCLLAVQALLGAAWLVLSPPSAQLLAGQPRCTPAGRFESELAVSLIYVLLLKLGLVCFCAAGWRAESAGGGREPEPRWLLATAGLTGAAWAGWLAAVLAWPAESSADAATVICNLVCVCIFFACLYLRKVLLFNYLWRNPDDPDLPSPVTVSTINNSFLMQMPAKLKNFSLVRTPQLSERIQENARTWNPAVEENGASLSFADDESVDLDRSLSVHEFTLSAQQRQRITAAACLHVETVTSSSESEDMDHYDAPKALNELVRRLGDRTVLMLPNDHSDGQDEDSKI